MSGMVIPEDVIRVDIFYPGGFRYGITALPIRPVPSQIVRRIQPEYPMFSNTFKAAGLGIAVALASVLSAQAEPVKIGSKNFTEQFIVAEIYAQALEKAGIEVE